MLSVMTVGMVFKAMALSHPSSIFTFLKWMLLLKNVRSFSSPDSSVKLVVLRPFRPDQVLRFP